MKQVVMIVLLLAYIISPIDLVPGPLDDIIITLLTLAANKKNSALN